MRIKAGDYRSPTRGSRASGRAVFAVTAAFAVAFSSGCVSRLARGGVATADILIPEAPHSDLARAAGEISSYVQKTAGAPLAIRRGDVAGPAPARALTRIQIGVTGENGVAPDRRIRSDEGYTIRTRGRTVTITGGSPRGALYGAYDFIERVLGVRWFMPSQMGEDLERKPTIDVPELDIVWNPAFGFVGGLQWAGGPGAADWELRMRARVGEGGGFGHNWHNVLPPTPENRSRYPSAFALVKGERGSSPQLCTEDPDTIRLSVDAARRHFDRNPRTPLFSLSPNDGYGWCEDDRCRRVDELYGVTDGTLSDRLVHYANRVAGELGRTHPGKRVAIYAYVNHSKPPQKAVPVPEYTTEVAHTPWEFCHVHALDDPACERNARFTEYVRGWTALTRHAGVYDYYGHFFAFTPWPIVRNIRRDIPFLHSLGIARFTSETQQNWANQGLNFYVAAKLLADPRLDSEALLNEYYRRFYGPAAAPMRLYWERFESEMTKTLSGKPEDDGRYAWLAMWRRPLIDAARADLDEAERLVKGPALGTSSNEKFATRVAFARMGFAYTEAVTEMYEAHYREDWRAVLEWTERAVERLRRTEGTEPQAFFVSVAIDQTRYLATLLTSKIRPWVQLRPLVESK